MKFQLAVVLSAAASVCAVPTTQSSIQTRAIAGLDETQSRHAQAIIDVVKTEGVGALGCQAAIATALTESELYMHANHAVPGSLDKPHDRVGADQDSVGLFQQRAVFYTDVGCTMDAACSAGLFVKDLRAVAGWQGMETAALCQAIQRSQIPDAYIKNVAKAVEVCGGSGLA
ncbi:hypothetical protein ISF_07859 [Cordyceps fumosorosea ARSEF 2679]|uniref:NLP/P60 protein n=1 Tax=Cordyceps fumosorosea (strain ARSEF 2679) TaxID=1081104 RepID=A0A167NNI6_CORFA|nr:hypothetical protein ISF_07859 [Cordyceps fumosorosea ARSEF 2679]OAA55754.1 hypothetical protein ISF_07859 [Cordyceps fumosorosea ARSEF 2679]